MFKEYSCIKKKKKGIILNAVLYYVIALACIKITFIQGSKMGMVLRKTTAMLSAKDPPITELRLLGICSLNNVEKKTTTAHFYRSPIMDRFI